MMIKRIDVTCHTKFFCHTHAYVHIHTYTCVCNQQQRLNSRKEEKKNESYNANIRFIHWIVEIGVSSPHFIFYIRIFSSTNKFWIEFMWHQFSRKSTFFTHVYVYNNLSRLMYVRCKRKKKVKDSHMHPCFECVLLRETCICRTKSV